MKEEKLREIICLIRNHYNYIFNSAQFFVFILRDCFMYKMNLYLYFVVNTYIQ